MLRGDQWRLLSLLPLLACARPAVPPPLPRTPEDIVAHAAALNDGWRTLRCRMAVALEMFSESAVERRSFRAMLLAQRPQRLRLVTTERGQRYFDLLWLGGPPQLLRPLPDNERSSRLRVVLGSLLDDLRVAFRIGIPSAPDIEIAKTSVSRPRHEVLLEVRHIQRGKVMTRAIYDRQTFHRKRLEQGLGDVVERTVHYDDHRRVGRTDLAHTYVIDNEKYDYSLTLQIAAVELDRKLPEQMWVP